MARVSKHVYYNIEESDISLEYKNLIFFFSSELNRDRYRTKILDFIDSENYKMKVKYNLEIDFSDMLLISYYSKIEKRGFKVLKRELNIATNELCLIKITKNDIIKSKVGE